MIRYLNLLALCSYIEFIVSVMFIYFEASCFVHVGDSVEFFYDIVCTPWSTIFFCEEGGLGWLFM